MPHPPHRGRHPRVRRGHVVRAQPVRGRLPLHVDGGPGAGGRLHGQGGPQADQGRGRAAQARRRRHRGRAARELHRQRDARRLPGVGGRERRRQGHVGVLLAPAGEEHRVRDAADRAHRARHRAPGRDAGLREGEGDGRARCRTGTRPRRSPSELRRGPAGAWCARRGRVRPCSRAVGSGRQACARSPGIPPRTHGSARSARSERACDARTSRAPGSEGRTRSLPRPGRRPLRSPSRGPRARCR